MARLLRAAALLLAIAALAAAALPAPAAAGGVAGGDLGHLVMRRGGRACRGTVGECMGYFDVDAEGEGDVAGMATGGSKRRVLQGGSGYIGYDALRRDNVPCSQRGASYYNCQPGAEANPYSRGCSAIAQCRG
ncbi:rapid alkalinization factor 1 precursor [Panicum miliaceum]|uniref:Rapid alkalinization factor 1 n=1 Tax=Panicum miliaceum TaxID=4540 RepID=A0A3L6R3P1_PANMI|nr:rapid alkalinization factor 1 precursor [Panicum miliaceum]